MNSFSVNPRVVMAGDPIRMPPGTKALLSPVYKTANSQFKKTGYDEQPLKTRVVTRNRVLVESDRGHVENFLHSCPIDTLLLEFTCRLTYALLQLLVKRTIMRNNDLPMA